MAACGGKIAAEKDSADADERWSVTAWGDRFEIFAELEPLAAGKVSRSNTHVTALADFSPLRQGSLAAVLREPDGRESVFAKSERRRDGIYVIEIEPAREGTFDLEFRVTTGQEQERIAAGRVQVGSAGAPGQLIAPAHSGDGELAAEEGEGTPFLKEQQWRTEFATSWVREGKLEPSVAGPARIIAAAGSEVVLSAPVDAVVAPAPWPYRGQQFAPDSILFQLTPRVEAERSLAQLQAEVGSLEAEAATAGRRAERLAALLARQAVSRAELERARAAHSGLEARLAAARRDLEAATAARTGGRSELTLAVRAPWRGRVAEVSVTPGQSVAAGAPLGRIIKPRPLWLDVALAAADAAQVTGRLEGLFLRGGVGAEPIAIDRDAVRLISRSPEIDAKTGTIGILLEIDRDASQIPIGTALEAEIALAGERRGVVIPAAALVDDAGVTVVYEQIGGESFARRPVRVSARQGRLALVEGIRPGIRLVTRGGAAIRRSSLLATGSPEGHVH